MISLNKAVAKTKDSNIVENIVNQIVSSFITGVTKCVTQKIIQALSFEQDSQKAIELINHSFNHIDGKHLIVIKFIYLEKLEKNNGINFDLLKENLNYATFDEYVKTIDDQEQLQELKKIQEIENLAENDQQSLEYIYLISRAIDRPIEIFINDSLHYTVGADLFGNDAIQIEKILTFQGSKWRNLTSNLFHTFYQF